MSRKDLTVIIAVAIVAGIFSYALATFMFGGEKTYKLKAPKVEPVSSQFTLPSEQYFNSQALNPTKDIIIGDTTNPSPFQSTR
jgi:flagellar basal body-associated protein FliL